LAVKKYLVVVSGFTQGFEMLILLIYKFGDHWYKRAGEAFN
jgi:hypothetical protein